MTPLLEQAVARIRELPEADQDIAAGLLFDFAVKVAGPIKLDAATRVAIREGIEQADRGELVSDEEMAAFFKRCGA
jgi:hypothetical protein